MVEGALAEVVGACTSGGVLTAWALYLELPLLLVGVLGALPFTAQLVQLPAAWCTRRFGSRRAALWTIGISRQCVLPLACLPFVPLPAGSKQAIFLGCAFTSAALSVAGTHPWTSWLGGLGPRSLLAFQLAWSAAGGIAAAFYPLHMIGNLRMGFARMAIYTAAVAAFRVLAAPLWGRVLDRGGARPVLFTSAFALSLSPLFWIFAMEGRLWPLAIDAAVSGVANAGLSLATFSLPLALSRPATRSFYVGALAAAGGLAAGIGSAAGGAVIKVLPGAWTLLEQPLVAAQALFLVGAAARLFAAVLALRVNERAPAEVVHMPRRADPDR